MLLGSVGAGALAFQATRSSALGVGTNIDLGDGFALGFDMVWSTTDGMRNPSSLLAETSRLDGFGFGGALAKSDFLTEGDRAGLTLKRPLRIYSGRGGLDLATGTD